MRYLTAAELKAINQYAVQMVGGSNYGVQSDASLKVVIEQPQQIVFGKELYPTIWLKAAFILQKITKKHVFVDGNKRTAIQAALYFLSINGYQIKDADTVNKTGEELMLMVTNAPDNEDVMLSVSEWLKVVTESNSK